MINTPRTSYQQLISIFDTLDSFIRTVVDLDILAVGC